MKGGTRVPVHLVCFILCQMACTLGLLLIGGVLPAFAAQAKQVITHSLSLEAGSAHVLKLQAIKQVAVGNSQLIQATAVSDAEVILFAKQPGVTTVDVWTKSGQHQAYQVTITSAGLKQRLAEITAVLKPLSGVSVRLAGHHIVVEGHEVSTDDRARLKELLARYPEVVDLTSAVAWDQMVMLDVKVLELPSHHLRELGVHWQSSATGGLQAGALWQLGTAGMGTETKGPIVSGRSGAMLGMNELLNARLQTMMQEGQAVLLAQPQLLARSGSPASFLAGGEVPYAFVDKEGKRTTLFKKYGVLLNVTPHVDPRGSIRAKVEVEVSAIDPSISTEAGPAMRVRKATTEFNVKSGQTLVVGGFVSHEKVSGREGLVGVFSDRRRQVELAIFVTPVLVTPDHPDLMARITRAQDIEDFELGHDRRINVPVNGAPDPREHRWHPSHPGLSQWGHGQRERPANTYAFDPLPTEEPR